MEQATGKQEAEEKYESVSSDLLGQLDRLLFGANPQPLDVKRWREQGFNFCAKKDIQFGLKQIYGGPCGILAPVQAFLLKNLLFSSPLDPNKLTNVSQEEVMTCLFRSLASIINHAHSDEGGLTVIMGDTLDKLTKVRLNSEEEVYNYLQQHVACLRSNIGVLLFVYSVLLSRGVDQIKSDMDDPDNCLVGRFGHCSQDLVNLMLIGRAVTNVFDGIKSLGGDADNSGFLMKGIGNRSTVGFLTLLEFLRYSKVGDNYKSPEFPVWVIGSSSHYTVLFALNPTVGQMTAEDKVLSRAKAAFLELDPEENGFIPIDFVQRLTQVLDIHAPLHELKTSLDPENMGICLWLNFKHLILKNLQDASKPVSWACGACTFLNNNARTTCEMCGSARPAPAPTTAVTTTKPPAPKSFELYHFNGLDGHGKTTAQCSRVSVRIMDEDAVSPPSRAQGLREVVRTRWPSAIVEYDPGPEPKI